MAAIRKEYNEFVRNLKKIGNRAKEGLAIRSFAEESSAQVSRKDHKC
jgi:hypothetical protein